METALELIKPTQTKPICKRCGSPMVYIRVDRTIVCRRCGYIDTNSDSKCQN